MVQNLNRPHLTVVPDDRRQRGRDQRRARILAAADHLVGEIGLDNLTMQGLADHLDCAVGTLYLSFPSKSALVAALEGAAIDALRGSFEAALPAWDDYLGDTDLGGDTQALVRLAAFGAHWASASVVLADEFRLQRSLLTDKVTVKARHETEDVVAGLGRLLEHPASLLADAARLGVLDDGDDRERALVWIAALDGVLLLDNLATVDRHLFRATHLARELTHALLVGWGAPRDDVEVADAHVDRLAALGPLAPPPSFP
jgi:AcrR family transcriptional regulator